ncbi:LAME_0E10088g1_1 [Lachancea meyersii CBS 8951]|uniref:LAME_0E10088g1_1 n=1 Tax=Lachancea meyersii CBS 8951 TaxID=1266667 RepID=A0A1G4JK06_9SACH|nr:LAME_0E10088g1_1 [Lachancea meyersii CBS 8951]
MSYEYHGQRSRSRSPGARRSSVNDYSGRASSDAPRPSRYNNGSAGIDNYASDYPRGRGRAPRGFRGGYRGSRGGYGDFPPRRRGRRDFRENDSFRSGEPDSAYDEKYTRNYANCAFVGNLTYDCQASDLKDLFSEVGHVVRSDIITARGHHRGMGTVEFTNPDDVGEAMRKFNGFSFLGRDIFVREDNPPPESGRRDERRSAQQSLADRFHPGYEVFIANLPFSISWQSLKDLFKECGVPTRADVKLDRNGRSRGFGTVIYETQEEAQAALDRFSGFELEGRILELKRGHGPWKDDIADIQDEHQEPLQEAGPVNSELTENAVGDGEKSNTLYVDNLPYATAKSDLFDLFEIIGPVNRAELRLDSTGEPTGVAVVEYEDIENAETCISRLDKYSYGGRELSISYVRYH